jgi:hypothetical protein
MTTYKQRFNKKYGFEPTEPHSLTDISKITGYKKSGLETIFDKGVGAFKTNPQSVRKGIRSPEQWLKHGFILQLWADPLQRLMRNI